MPAIERVIVIWKLFFIGHFLQSMNRKLSFYCKETCLTGIVFSRAKAFLGIKIILQEHKIVFLKMSFTGNGIKLSESS